MTRALAKVRRAEAASSGVPRRFWRRFARRPAALIGLGALAAIVVVALLAPQLTPYTPWQSVGLALQPPSRAHWFGTDDLGRDLFSGVVYGARTSLLIAAIVAAASLLIGVSIGALAGFFGGWLDDLLMRFTELVLVLPRFFLALVVAALFGPSLVNLILVLSLTSWEFVARLTRAGVLSAKVSEYALAARALGCRDMVVLFKHVLPNVLAPVVAYLALLMGGVILTEAGLSFLGLGDPNVISWGYLLNNAQAFLRRAPWLSLFPGLAIAVTVLAINLLADGLSAYWNPQARDRFR